MATRMHKQKPGHCVSPRGRDDEQRPEVLDVLRHDAVVTSGRPSTDLGVAATSQFVIRGDLDHFMPRRADSSRGALIRDAQHATIYP